MKKNETKLDLRSRKTEKQRKRKMKVVSKGLQPQEDCKEKFERRRWRLFHDLKSFCVPGMLVTVLLEEKFHPQSLQERR